MKESFIKLLSPLLFIVIFLCTLPLCGHENPDHKSIAFIKNLGQWEEEIRYKANLNGGAVFLEERCITYVFLNVKEWEQFHQQKFNKEIKRSFVSTHAYKVHFKNANANLNFLKKRNMNIITTIF